jgi:tol-pal system protein YbgF
MFRRLSVCLILCIPVLLPAADKDLVLLQRYVANLEEDVRNLQKSLDEKLAALSEKQAGQLSESADQSSKAIAALGDRFQKGLQDQQDRSVASLAALNTRMQEISGDLGDMKEAVTSLTTAVNKLSTQLTGIEDAIKIMQAPQPAPPAATGPSMSAKDTYDNAYRDFHAGNLDLAQSGFAEFLKWYSTDAQAPNAQFYIGSIQYSSKQFDDAVKSFDLLLQNYPASDRVPEALFYKGKSFADSARWPDAMETFSQLRKRFPTHALAKQAAAIKPPAK